MLYQNHAVNAYNFGPACESEAIVFGAQRPGFPAQAVSAMQVSVWIEFMRAQSIRRVCCLLSGELLACYTDLLGDYRAAFGERGVCHAPIEDFQLCDPATLRDAIVPFLAEADRLGQRAVVHCAAGSGRTGHVLAAWLVHRHHMGVEEALQAVRLVNGARRNPLEAVDGEARLQALYTLLRGCTA